MITRLLILMSLLLAVFVLAAYGSGIGPVEGSIILVMLAIWLVLFVFSRRERKTRV